MGKSGCGKVLEFFSYSVGSDVQLSQHWKFVKVCFLVLVSFNPDKVHLGEKAEMP
jgi:hypothetical protein